MTAVYFIYGLAFFSCGLILLLYPMRGSTLRIAPVLPLLGTFGVLHGACEWAAMFNRVYPEHSSALTVAKLVLMSLSFSAHLAKSAVVSLTRVYLRKQSVAPAAIIATHGPTAEA